MDTLSNIWIEQTTKHEQLKKELDPKNIDILDREYFYRINAYGFMKKIQTKK